MGAPALADATVLGEPKPGLVNPRIEPDIAHQLLRGVETMDVTNRGNQPGGGGEVDTGNRQQSPDRGIIADRLGDFPVEPLQVLAEPIEFTQVALNGGPFVIRERLARQPSPPPVAEQIGVRTQWDQVGAPGSVDSGLDNRILIPINGLRYTRQPPGHNCGYGTGRRPYRWHGGHSTLDVAAMPPESSVPSTFNLGVVCQANSAM